MIIFFKNFSTKIPGVLGCRQFWALKAVDRAGGEDMSRATPSQITWNSRISSCGY